MDNFILSRELAPDGKILTQTTEVYIQQPNTNDIYHIIIIYPIILSLSSPPALTAHDSISHVE